jgi:hypothetical protein
MDVQINEVATTVEVRDIAALRKAMLDDPQFWAALRRWREEDERLRGQRDSDRAADVRRVV